MKAAGVLLADPEGLRLLILFVGMGTDCFSSISGTWWSFFYRAIWQLVAIHFPFK